MGLIVDASVFIAHERGHLGTDPTASGAPQEPLYLSVITVSELLHGVHRANTKARRERRKAFVEHLIGRIPRVEFDLESARTYARIWADLARRGVVLQAHDLMIGAQALTLGLDVLTVNTKDFGRIPGLEVRVCPGRNEESA